MKGNNMAKARYGSDLAATMFSGNLKIYRANLSYLREQRRLRNKPSESGFYQR